MKHVFDKLDASRKGVVYQQEAAKLEFALQISARMDELSVSRADLAAAIGHSPAYVTKVLRGDNNLTIETMVELCHILGGRLHFKIADDDQRIRWRGVVDGGGRSKLAVTDTRAWAHPERDSNRNRFVTSAKTDDEGPNVFVA